MQNWEHLETVLEKCNQLPKDAKDVDVNRCHEFHLNGAAACARQTIFLSQFETAEINATFNGSLCVNVEGKFRLRATKEKGVLGLVASPDDPRNLRKNQSGSLPNLISRQEFELVRVSKKNIKDADDIRFRHFAKAVLPRIRENPDQGQLIFCATYFEFVRVRNLLVDREVSFAINSEYIDIAEAARARTLFADGRKRCLLLSERAYSLPKAQHPRRQLRLLLFLTRKPALLRRSVRVHEKSGASEEPPRGHWHQRDCWRRRARYQNRPRFVLASGRFETRTRLRHEKRQENDPGNQRREREG